MQFWNNIVNAGMMGTDKKTIGSDELPAGLTEPAKMILSNESVDKEEKFLQLAALAFNYRQCGFTPLKKEHLDLIQAPSEVKDYCQKSSMQLLKDIFNEESYSLLKFWLESCDDKRKIVHPEIIPALLGAGVQNKTLQTLITACCGKRGEWVSRFNEAWNFSTKQTADEQWQTGTREQRKAILSDTRQNNPALAREWLQQTWSQEDAGTKQMFLEILLINISAEDIPFLESLQTEKSKKVKEESVRLMKHVPESSIVKMYWEVLQQSLLLKKEKALLGLSSKTVLHAKLPSNLSEEIFKTGIEKLSGQKGISDDSFILYQLVSYTPPQFWESHFDLSPGEIVTLFNQSKEAKELLPAIGLAVSRFKNATWAPFIIKDEGRLHLDIINLLPPDKKENYLLLHFNNAPEEIINAMTKQETEWSLELAKKILRHAAQNPYHYNRSFFNQHIHLIPGKIALDLEKFTPTEQHLLNTWSNTSEYILKLLHIKEQIIHAFN